jgi:hypothetical protein
MTMTAKLVWIVLAVIVALGALSLAFTALIGPG